jgi:hypothetical protein
MNRPKESFASAELQSNGFSIADYSMIQEAAEGCNWRSSAHYCMALYISRLMLPF